MILSNLNILDFLDILVIYPLKYLNHLKYIAVINHTKIKYLNILYKNLKSYKNIKLSKSRLEMTEKAVYLVINPGI